LSLHGKGLAAAEKEAQTDCWLSRALKKAFEK
jgi:hypothetical protein